MNTCQAAIYLDGASTDAVPQFPTQWYVACSQSRPLHGSLHMQLQPSHMRPTLRSRTQAGNPCSCSYLNHELELISDWACRIGPEHFHLAGKLEDRVVYATVGIRDTSSRRLRTSNRIHRQRLVQRDLDRGSRHLDHRALRNSAWHNTRMSKLD